MRKSRLRVFRLLAAGAAIALVAAACGDDGGSESASSSSSSTVPGASVQPATSAQAQAGGTLTIATFIEPPGLDPLVAAGSGVVGGMEMMAIYDSVMQYNAQTGKYEGRTGQSLEANSDSTEWTLKIKPNIKFSDGTDYDAEAVKFGIDRSRSGQPGAPPCGEIRACPRSTSAAAGPMGDVKTTEVIDKLTLKITLSGSWPGFPAMLSSTPGMIPSPTAMKAACPADTTSLPRACPFNLAPVGAGPFIIDSFRPKEAISMKKNPNYWGGNVLLDGLKFINFADAGSQKTYDALTAGTAQVAFLRDPQLVAKAKSEKLGGLSFFQQAGNILLMNNGVSVRCAGGLPAPACTGRPDGAFTPPTPTQQLKVRQAVAAAVDAKVVNDRAFNGAALAGTELFQKGFRYDPGVPGPTYDLNRAKQLVQEAKTAGWDGRIRYMTDSAPTNQQTALAVQAMLQLAGMTVDIDTVESTVIATNKRDGSYQLASHGFNITDDDMGTARNLAGNLTSTSSTNRMGYKSTQMDAAIAQLKAAKDDAAKTAAYRTIAQLYLQDAPFLVLGAVDERLTWVAGINGITPGLESISYFDKAWIQK